MQRIALCLLLLLPTTALVGADDVTFERVLVPTIIAPTPGGFGSLWSSELYVFNGANQPVYVEYSFSCQITCPSGLLIDPGVAQEPPSLVTPPLATPGMLFYVERPLSEEFTFSLRIKDLSRQALTWGTEIPVIREDEAETSTVELLNIPLDERFRQNLRVYDLDAHTTAIVHIKYFAMDAGTLLAEQDVTLHAPQSSNPRPLDPGYAIIDSLRAIPGLTSTDRVRAQITPITPGLRFWAFASVTNNETQHVTIITPQ